MKTKTKNGVKKASQKSGPAVKAAKAVKKPAKAAGGKKPLKTARPSGAAKGPAAKKAVKPVKVVKTAKPALSSKKAVGAAVKKPVVKPAGKVAMVVHKPAPEPVRKPVVSGAMKAFEQAMKVFNKRQFEEAKAMFENVASRYPAEVEFAARAQTYIQICNQKLEHRAAAPRNADDLYDRGVFALNIGDFTQAKTFFEKALRLKPNEPHLLYSLAATHAQTGAMDQALDYLKKSILIQPRLRGQALNDSDFSGLRENKQFLELLGLTSPFDRLEGRR